MTRPGTKGGPVSLQATVSLERLWKLCEASASRTDNHGGALKIMQALLDIGFRPRSGASA